MSGCHVPLNMGNVAYAPGYGGSCTCPCHHNPMPLGMAYYQCYCNCRKIYGGLPQVIYLENKVMEDRIKNIETRLKELEEWTRKDEDKVHEHLKDLQKNYHALSEELRYVLENFNKKPHKCPICEGLGGTSISGTIDEYCYPCRGRGIVWG